MTDRMYDVFCITLPSVIQKAWNVSKDDALLTMARTLADYGSNWQLQPENPRGVVKVINLLTSEYHIVAVIETELSQSRHEVDRIIERQQLRWLANVNRIETFQVGIEAADDYTVDPDRTPYEDIADSLRDGSDALEVEEAQNA